MTGTVPTVALGSENDAPRIPLLGFGTWQATGDEVYNAVRTALDVGYRHIDTATMYGNEADVGRAVADSGIDRADLFITTKCPPERVGRERETLDASLRDLGLDHVDLWLVHWPPDGGATPAMWERFVEAQQAGRARSVGVSNYTPGQIDELADATGVTPVIDQIPWSPGDHDPDLVAALRDRGVVLEGYSPFKRTDMDAPALDAAAEAHGVTPQQVVVRWHLQHGFVVIPKSVHAERIASNFDVLVLELTAQEMDSLDALGA